MEGTSGRHGASPFTRGCSRRPRRLARPEKRKLKEREGGPTFRYRGRGDRGVRGTIVELRPWEENAHARSAPHASREGRGTEAEAKRAQSRSAEAFSGVVKHPVPWSSERSPRVRPGPRGANRGGARSSRGTGTRNRVRWQKSVRRIARLLRRRVARPSGERGR